MYKKHKNIGRKKGRIKKMAVVAKPKQGFKFGLAFELKPEKSEDFKKNVLTKEAVESIKEKANAIQKYIKEPQKHE